ncbi:MAG: DUF3185 domain-containing protein [Gemmatimonadota bacterium]|nr:DUF3185 domain-containing protein [Gemmatimonadota bacterium]
MRPLGIVGILLVVVGIAILAMRGVSYTKNQQSVEVGPLAVTTKERGFVPPVVGILAIAAGAVLLVTSRRRPG